MEKIIYQNVTITIEEKTSEKGNVYIATVAHFKKNNEIVDVFLGFDKIAKDIVFKVGK